VSKECQKKLAHLCGKHRTCVGHRQLHARGVRQ